MPEAYPDFLSENPTITLIYLPVSYHKTLSNKTKAKVEILQNSGLRYLSSQFLWETFLHVILDENNAIMCQISSGVHAYKSENTIQYRGRDIRIYNNKYKLYKDETIKILYDLDKGSKAIHRGLKLLQEEPNHDLIHAELSALKSEDLLTAIKDHSKYFPEILCSFIASTGTTLKLILAEDTEKVNKNKISHTIKNIEKKIKSSDAELIANAPDISSNEAEILKQNPKYSFADNITLQ
ncbi:3431_t:CDS:2 [Scutellospora calospora]|uniref:3431_t:CDS:1 n=1 Tax=Scutellospora calospora TaxID=85575 RepID=A0ACA9KS58_9GLOM|nr:3431_t:CDS:2 [Scutellospora calospora]